MGLRSITSSKSPGIAVRKVTTKKFAQPILDTTNPAIDPMLILGRLAIADSKAYWVAL